MKHTDYAAHVTRFTDEMRAVTAAKNADYSAGTDDAMQNYYELANASGIKPVQAWMTLMMKHVTAIMRYAKTGSVSSETIHGRFIDLANYALLGDALVTDIEAKAKIKRGEKDEDTGDR
jgi:hypothetical protein